MKKSILAVAILLFSASLFMFVSGNQTGKTQLQAAPVTPQEMQQIEKAENPYVIRNGSNELPPGVQGEDPKKQWMPAWQKDRILDQKGVPMIGSPQEMYGKNADGTFAGSSSAAPSDNTASGDTAQPTEAQPSSSPDPNAGANSDGGGITPAIADQTDSGSSEIGGMINNATP